MESLPSEKLALLVEYDGAKYHGFQVQVGVPTIQGDIERALMKINGDKIRIVGAGRTDAGVHARGQVISFPIELRLTLRTLIRALNFYLAPDIAVRDGVVVDGSFNARRDAISREYRYTILNSVNPSPIQRRHAHFVPLPLDIDAMNQACQCLVGTHDFASFTIPMESRTIRSVFRAVLSRAGDMIFFDIVANSFLPKQVRFIVGSLLRVGLGKMTVEGFQEMLRAGKPGLAVAVAPAHGLCLIKVNYPSNKFSRGQFHENL